MLLGWSKMVEFLRKLAKEFSSCLNCLSTKKQKSELLSEFAPQCPPKPLYLYFTEDIKDKDEQFYAICKYYLLIIITKLILSRNHG